MTKGNVRRVWIILGVVTALLGAGIVAILAFGRTAAPLTLPNPNGYDDLLRAGQLVTGEINEARDLDHEGLRVLVATNAEALRLLRVGLARSCAVATDAQIANFA